MNPPRVSVAIPIFNEEQVLPELYRRVHDVLAELPGDDHEIVFVDDGSSDGTFELLEAIATIDPQVRAIALSRNFGHQAALSAALDQVQGDVVVLMDGDLQDAPEAIPMFLAQYAAGYDVVYAIRRQRKEGLLKRGCYAAFYRIISRMAEIDLPRDAGDFSLLSRRVVDVIRRSPERHRYLRGLRSWVGFRQIGVPVNRDARSAGKSKYGPRKLLQLAFDGIFSFSVLPLRVATIVGAMVVLGSAAFAGYATFVHLFFSRSPQGFTALIVAVVFLAGIQLLFLGVCGEYIGRIYEQVKQRPQYVVDRIVTADAERFNPPRQPADQSAASPAAVSTTMLASC
ncbi:MAG: glycosyltransferase family 2 protein [Pirellulales bacterium]|nr:glycosyltransferase family 2 protein [Pirellulales bacterium]